MRQWFQMEIIVLFQTAGRSLFWRSMEKVSMRRVVFAAGLGEFHHHQRSLWRLRPRNQGGDISQVPKLPTLFHLVGDPDLSDFSVPLMDMGLDSLSAVEFRNRVQAPWVLAILWWTLSFAWLAWLVCSSQKRPTFFGHMHKVTSYQAIGFGAAKPLFPITSIWIPSPFTPDFWERWNWSILVHQSNQTKTTGSSMTGTIIAIYKLIAGWGAPIHLCFIWTPMTWCCWCKKSYTSSETKRRGPWWDIDVYCPHQMVLGTFQQRTSQVFPSSARMSRTARLQASFDGLHLASTVSWLILSWFWMQLHTKIETVAFKSSNEIYSREHGWIKLHQKTRVKQNLDFSAFALRFVFSF